MMPLAKPVTLVVEYTDGHKERVPVMPEWLDMIQGMAAVDKKVRSATVLKPLKEEWNEEDHPRAPDGKFGDGGGEGTKGEMLAALNAGRADGKVFDDVSGGWVSKEELSKLDWQRGVWDGKPREWKAAETMRGIRSQMAEHPYYSHTELKGWNQMTPARANDVAAGLFTFANDVGVGLPPIETVSVQLLGPSVYAQYQGSQSEVKLNSTWFGKEAEGPESEHALSFALERNDRTGWTAPGTGTVEGIMEHELGHHLAYNASYEFSDWNRDALSQMHMSEYGSSGGGDNGKGTIDPVKENFAETYAFRVSNPDESTWDKLLPADTHGAAAQWVRDLDKIIDDGRKNQWATDT